MDYDGLSCVIHIKNEKKSDVFSFCAGNFTLADNYDIYTSCRIYEICTCFCICSSIFYWDSFYEC